MEKGLKIGTLLDHGKYRVERIIGQGGFGITYLVTDLGLDKVRAIKEFFPKEYCDREADTSHITVGMSHNKELVEKLKAKFIREARNIANLDQHPGIIKIHSVFEENNTAYYVMDYIEGESLSSLVKANGPINEERALRIISEAGAALEYVHSHNINHLDVKPANIMIRRKDDKPILIDFGLAKQYDSDGMQISSMLVGVSHGYAPIEQYTKDGLKTFTPQTDIYALAATLYYILSGVVPPQAPELVSGNLAFPEGFPVRLMGPIATAMSLAIPDRPPTVTNFIESLNVSVKESGSTEPKPKSPEPEPRPQPKAPEPKPWPEPKSPKPEPLRQPPQPWDLVEPDEKNTSPVSKGKKSWFPIAIGLGAFLVVAVIILVVYNGFVNDSPSLAEDSLIEESAIPIESAEVNSKVENASIQTALGPSPYTGEVDEQGLPHGHVWPNGIRATRYRTMGSGSTVR